MRYLMKVKIKAQEEASGFQIQATCSQVLAQLISHQTLPGRSGSIDRTADHEPKGGMIQSLEDNPIPKPPIGFS